MRVIVYVCVSLRLSVTIQQVVVDRQAHGSYRVQYAPQIVRNLPRLEQVGDRLDDAQYIYLTLVGYAGILVPWLE